MELEREMEEIFWHYGWARRVYISTNVRRRVELWLFGRSNICMTNVGAL